MSGRRPYPPVSPKYRNPDQPSETWAGRGKRPRWLVKQLKSGRRVEDFENPGSEQEANQQAACGAQQTASVIRSIADSDASDAIHSVLEPHTRTQRLRIVFLKPRLRGILVGEDLEVILVANLLARARTKIPCSTGGESRRIGLNCSCRARYCDKYVDNFWGRLCFSSDLVLLTISMPSAFVIGDIMMRTGYR